MRWRSWLLALMATGAVARCGSGAASSGEAPCASAIDCEAPAEACREAYCDLETGTCRTRDLANGDPCDVGAVCFAGACLTACERSEGCDDGLLCASRRLGPGATIGLCVPAEQVPCSADAACLEVLIGPCEAASCDAALGRCRLGPAVDGAACGPWGACYRGQCYTACVPGPAPCEAGQACVEPRAGLSLCVPEGAIPCSGDAACGALVTGLCHLARCVDGACLPVPASNGAGCAPSRTCWAGACVGSGACDATGACPAGSTCVTGSDGDVCVPDAGLTCAGSGDCAAVRAPDCRWATCDPVAARCDVQAAPDGGACGDGGVCLGGACVAPCADSGACAPGAFCRPVAGATSGGCVEVPCTSPGDCLGLLVTLDACEAVACNTLTNRCQVAPLPQDASCDDGDLCNGVSRCRDGACVLTAKPVECATPPGQGCTAIGCDPASGACVASSAPDGTACDDGSPCSSDTTCQQGVCTAGQVTCTTCQFDQDCLPSDDGDLCNGVPLCLGGVCAWSPLTLVSCPAPSDPCQAVACEPASGACVTGPVDDGTPCAVSPDLCAPRSECAAGACVEVASAVSCPVSDDPCLQPACDPASGTCGTLPLDEAELLSASFDLDVSALVLAVESGPGQAQVTYADAYSPPGALALHADPGVASVLGSPPLGLPAGQALLFRAAARVQLDLPAGDTLLLTIGSEVGGWQTLVQADAAHPPASSAWFPVAVTLAPLPEGAVVRARLAPAGATGVELLLDDVQVVRPCP